MAVSFNHYEDFVEQLGKKKHDLDADTLKVMLSNTAPNASTHTVRADCTEISAGNGYTSGGEDITNAYAESGGTGSLTSADTVVFTASGGAIAQFRYVILYNDTQTSPADPLIGWWDYGSAVDLADGETFTVDFGATVLTITTA